MEILQRLVQMENGFHLGALETWAVPSDPLYHQYFITKLWEKALENQSNHAFHALLLHTWDTELEYILQMVTKHHLFSPMVGLLHRIEQAFPDTRVLPLISCSHACYECDCIRDVIVSIQDCHADYRFVRSKLREGRQRNLYEMWRPMLKTNSCTRAIFDQIEIRSKKNWNLIWKYIVCRILWRRFIERVLRPDSKYIQFVRRKFYARV